jgi:hypothetical protein
MGASEKGIADYDKSIESTTLYIEITRESTAISSGKKIYYRVDKKITS